jgi:hypothetical protein
LLRSAELTSSRTAERLGVLPKITDRSVDEPSNLTFDLIDVLSVFG